MDDVDKFFETIFLDGLTLRNQIISLSSIINILFAALMAFMIILVYQFTSDKDKRDISLVQSIPILSILMAVIMRVSSGREAIFFGIFGILSIVRYRSELTEQRGITYILFAIVMGVLSGIGSFLLAVIAFIIISCVIIFIRFVFKLSRYKSGIIYVTSFEPLLELRTKSEEVLREIGINYSVHEMEDSLKKDENKRLIAYKIFEKNDILLIHKYKIISEKLTNYGYKIEFFDKE